MRYVVESKVLDKDHPQFPGEKHYFVVDILTGKRTLGSYTTLESAKGIASKKNNDEGMVC